MIGLSNPDDATDDTLATKLSALTESIGQLLLPVNHREKKMCELMHAKEIYSGSSYAIM